MSGNSQGQNGQQETSYSVVDASLYIGQLASTVKLLKASTGGVNLYKAPDGNGYALVLNGGGDGKTASGLPLYQGGAYFGSLSNLAGGAVYGGASGNNIVYDTSQNSKVPYASAKGNMSDFNGASYTNDPNGQSGWSGGGNNLWSLGNLPMQALAPRAYIDARLDYLLNFNDTVSGGANPLDTLADFMQALQSYAASSDVASTFASMNSRIATDEGNITDLQNGLVAANASFQTQINSLNDSLQTQIATNNDSLGSGITALKNDLYGSGGTSSSATANSLYAMLFGVGGSVSNPNSVSTSVYSTLFGVGGSPTDATLGSLKTGSMLEMATNALSKTTTTAQKVLSDVNFQGAITIDKTATAPKVPTSLFTVAGVMSVLDPMLNSNTAVVAYGDTDNQGALTSNKDFVMRLTKNWRIYIPSGYDPMNGNAAMGGYNFAGTTAACNTLLFQFNPNPSISPDAWTTANALRAPMAAFDS